MNHPSHILFDYCGTLVGYEADRQRVACSRSHECLQDWGAECSYGAFVGQWDSLSAQFERRSETTLDEFSFTDLCEHFLGRMLGSWPSPAQVRTFRDVYLEEWGSWVVYPDGVNAMLETLARDHTLVLVSNTHHADLVRGHLDASGLAAHLHHVVTSVEHGSASRPPSCSGMRSASPAATPTRRCSWGILSSATIAGRGAPGYPAC